YDVPLAARPACVQPPQAPRRAPARTTSRPTCRYTWSILQGGTTLPHLPLRTVEPATAAAAAYDAWLEQIEERLAASDPDWNGLCRDVLFELYHPGLSDYAALIDDPSTPSGARAALLALDPRNITL